MTYLISFSFLGFTNFLVGADFFPRKSQKKQSRTFVILKVHHAFSGGDREVSVYLPNPMNPVSKSKKKKFDAISTQ